MRRYLLGYLASYAVSILAFAAMMLLAIGNWLFTDSPLWFDVLWVIAAALPVLALGEVFGRKPEAKKDRGNGLGLGILLAGMGLLTLISGASEFLQILIWPGLLLGNVMQTLLGGSGYWDGAFILLGNLSMPLLFHLGWRWGVQAAK